MMLGLQRIALVSAAFALAVTCRLCDLAAFGLDRLHYAAYRAGAKCDAALIELAHRG